MDNHIGEYKSMCAHRKDFLIRFSCLTLLAESTMVIKVVVENMSATYETNNSVLKYNLNHLKGSSDHHTRIRRKVMILFWR